jgi:hypothetical protein
MTRIMNVAANPIAIEICPPWATRAKRSRPNLSVENGWSRLKPAYDCPKSTSFGS